MVNLPNSLENLISRIESGDPGQGDGFAIVELDSKGKAVEKRPRFSFRRKRILYRVGNSGDPKHIVEGVGEPISVRPYGSSDLLEIRIRYRVKCLPGDETKVAEALFDRRRSPIKVLNDFLDRKAQEFITRDESAFIQNFETRAPELASILGNACRELHLAADVRVEPVGGDLLRPESVAFDVTVRPSDSVEEVPLRVDLEIGIENQVRALAAKNRLADVEARVRREVIAFIAGEVSMGDFLSALPHAVRDRLAQRLDSALRPEGRKVLVLELSSQEAGELPPPIEHEFHTPSKLAEYADEIRIFNRIRVVVDDLAKHRRARIESVDSWLESLLNRIIGDVVYGSSYLDLLDETKWEALEKRIKDAARHEAEAHGFRIKHLLAVPDLPELKLLKDHEMQIKRRFASSLPSTKITLDVIINYRLRDLSKITTLIQNDAKGEVEDGIRDDVTGAIAEILHRVSPTEILEFPGSEDEEGDRPPQITARISERVHQVLTIGYNAEVAQVIPKIVHMDGMLEFEELAKTTESFSVQIDSHGWPEPITFTGNYRVTSPSPADWETFRKTSTDREKLKDSVVQTISSVLQTESSKALLFQDKKGRGELEESLNAAVIAQLSSQHGLIVHVFNLARQKTELQQARDEAFRETHLLEPQVLTQSLKHQKDMFAKGLAAESESADAVARQLQQVYTQLEIEASKSDNEDVVEELQERAKALEAAMPKPDVKSLLSGLRSTANELQAPPTGGSLESGASDDGDEEIDPEPNAGGGPSRD